MRSVLFLTALCGALVFSSLRAEKVDLQPTVQVTASRVAETVDETLADVSIITREDIEQSVARDTLDLLRLQPGIDFYRTGGPGNQTSLFLRGTNSNQVLVLIDGVRVSAVTTGAFALEHLPIDAIERIEIVRGPRASYWGSDAIGGVIQIFTRRLEGPRVAAGYGSYEDGSASAGFGRWDGADGFSVQLGARHVDGFSATNRGICAGPEDPYCIWDPDDDGYRNINLAARGARTIGSQILSAMLYRSQGKVEFDQGSSKVREQVAGISLEGELAASWSHRLNLGDAREHLRTPAFGAEYETRRQSFLWQNEFRIDSRQRLVAGLDFVRERGQTLDTFAGLARYRHTRDNRALFAGWRGEFDHIDAELAARRDDNTVFGGANTGSAALGWHNDRGLRLYASLGQGFRSPTMNELYDPGYGGWFAGNPTLRPERSLNSELGLEAAFSANQRLKFNLYSNRVWNLISFTGPQNQAENIAHARIDGAELGWMAELGDWFGNVNYTWQRARDRDTGMALLRRARNKFSFVLERRFLERLSLGAETLWIDRRPDVGGVALGSYALLNLRARWDIDHSWNLGLRLENLTDRDYEWVRGYNASGRAAHLEVVWRP